MMEVYAAGATGCLLGCIVTYAFAVRPRIRVIEKMRYSGFIRDEQPKKQRPPKPYIVNET